MEIAKKFLRKPMNQYVQEDKTTTAIQPDTGGIHVIFGICQFFVGVQPSLSLFLLNFGIECVLIGHHGILCGMLYPLSNQFIQAAQYKKYVNVAVLSDMIEGR
jgi:hypothetical protein